MLTYKGRLQIAGKPLFERVLEVFRESFDRLVLVGDRAERFSCYGLPVLPDIYPGSALGGLYTGLYHSATEHGNRQRSLTYFVRKVT
ncbi:MAG: NTP transferase domain-containing protein [Pseudomonadota bacterium]